MGSSKAPSPDSSSESDKPSPPPPDSESDNSSPPDSDSSTSPPTEKDSSPPPPRSPPPSDSSPPPPKKSSSPPPSPPASSPPPPENSSPPPTPTKKSPPPPSTPESTLPAPAGDDTKSPPPPVDGASSSPPPPAGDLVKSPPGKSFMPPPPALASNQTTSSAGGSSSDSAQSSGGSSSSVAVIAGAVVGGVVLITLLICLWMLCRRKKKSQQYYNQVWRTPSPDFKQHIITIPPGNLVGMPSPAASGWSAANLPSRPPGTEGGYSPYRYPNRTPAQSTLPPFSPDVGGFSNQSSLPYDDVVAATDGFAKSNMLGQGGFGLVHKGILPGGKQVAVKSLKSGSGQGEREFQAEVEIISRVHHRHLVSLVGYCIAAEKRLLVYEFVPNNTLEYHLHESGKSPLDFPTRVRIALGSAKGLAYLHEDCHPRIIHRDIKAANILLDQHFEAQVADFGLARLFNDTNTHVSTRVMGTFGYLAPEYASSGKLTDKSDVFSFGVVLLELITGRRPVDPDDRSMEDCSLVDWARPLLAKALAEGNCYDELVDQRLEGNYNLQDMANMVACAATSIRHSGKRRPRMSQIVRALEGDMSLEALDGTRTGQSTPSREYDTAAYNADLKKFREIAFGTGTITTTSEYGLNPSSSSSEADTSPRDSANLSLLL